MRTCIGGSVEREVENHAEIGSLGNREDNGIELVREKTGKDRIKMKDTFI